MASTCCWKASGSRLHAREPEIPQPRKPGASESVRRVRGRNRLGLRSDAVAGIDFGTTHSTISVVLEQKVLSVPVDEDGSVLLPSTVCYRGDSGTSCRSTTVMLDATQKHTDCSRVVQGR
jgi:hypothetical protein